LRCALAEWFDWADGEICEELECSGRCGREIASIQNVDHAIPAVTPFILVGFAGGHEFVVGADMPDAELAVRGI